MTEDGSARELPPTVRADLDGDLDGLTEVVALDGPAGSGKSTVARRTAAALGWRFVDTGATYRAATLAALRAGLDPNDPAADPDQVAAVACSAVIELSTSPQENWVRLDGSDVTAEIRQPAVAAQVSAVAALPAVRRHLIALQRQLMGTAGAVVEGRDISTVVAPRAKVKVYLDASPEERARRRSGELASAPARTVTPDLDSVAAALAARDAKDNETNRLEASDGAVHLDTTHLSLDQVVEAVVALVRACDSTPAPVTRRDAP